MKTTRPPAIQPNNTPAVIDANKVYTFKEAARRLRWKQHSTRQARRMGLRVVKFGSRNYVLGQHVLEFFQRLAEEQRKDLDAREGQP